jgi:hypothetical protein
MTIPTPEKGLVIRYAFLWSDEFEAGRLEGRKDRPCAILMARTDDAGETRVLVVPVTHSPPAVGQNCLALTPAEREIAGLDEQPAWVVLDEINRFTWPGYDLRKVPGTDRYHYGRLPEPTFRRIVKAIRDLDTAKRAIPRDQ